MKCFAAALAKALNKLAFGFIGPILWLLVAHAGAGPVSASWILMLYCAAFATSRSYPDQLYLMCFGAFFFLAALPTT